MNDIGGNEMMAGQEEQPFGLIAFQQKDKFAKFYDRSKDDYIFKIENLPEAFAKLEESEPLD